MSFSKRNDTLYIDTEALSTLALVQEGLLKPVTKLMNKEEAQEVDRTKRYKGIPLPFSFILSPKGKRNQENIQNFKKGDKVILLNNSKEVGYLIVDEVFKIDKDNRLKLIYGSNDVSIPVIKRASKRLGEWAVSGEYRVEYPKIRESIELVKKTIKRKDAKKISGMVLGANPITRAQERVIRSSLRDSDILILFLIKPFTKEGLNYDVRRETLEIYVNNYLPSQRVVIIPFENSYIFSGYNELILDVLLAKNYGCNKIVIGKNHRGLGMLIAQDEVNTVFDTFKDINIDVNLVDEYVYCDICRTLVNTHTCPHGQHHHIHYHHKPIMELIRNGILPPTILVRKEISAKIIAYLFPDRFKRLQETYDMLIPNSGLLEEKSEEDFYIKLMELYQTSSLT